MKLLVVTALTLCFGWTELLHADCLQDLRRMGLSLRSLASFAQFFAGGGDGTVLKVTSLDPQQAGVFLVVSKLPTSWPPGAPPGPASELALKRLQQLLDSGTPILFRDAAHDFAGATRGKSDIDVALSQHLGQKPLPCLLVTADSDPFMVEHETKHLSDILAIAAPLARLQILADEQKLSGTEANAIATFLLEQRAYTVERAALDRELAQRPSMEIWPSGKKLKDHAAERMQAIARLFTADGHYPGPVTTSLSAIEARDPALYSELKQMIAKHMEADTDLTVENILPLHFKQGAREVSFKAAETALQQVRAFQNDPALKEKVEFLIRLGRVSKFEPKMPPRNAEIAQRVADNAVYWIAHVQGDSLQLDTPLRLTTPPDQLRGGQRLTVNEAFRAGNLGDPEVFWNEMGLGTQFRARFPTDDAFWKSPLSLWQVYEQLKSQ